MPTANEAVRIKAASYSACIADVVNGQQQRGMVHSTFAAAANVLFPGGFLLSLNASTSAQMPNGIQLPFATGAFPFSRLHPTMPVLLGAGQVIIDAIDFALDLSYCPHWNPHIEHPQALDMNIVRNNGKWLANYTSVRHPQAWHESLVWHPQAWHPQGVSLHFTRVKCSDTPCGCQAWGCRQDIYAMARYLCGRGPGLTPSGDDMLAGWMALQWLLYGPEPRVIAACQQILEIASIQTHLLSQCWLSYAAQGNVALPVRDLLLALPKEDDETLAAAAQTVQAMGATSGCDLISRHPFRPQCTCALILLVSHIYCYCASLSLGWKCSATELMQ